MNIQYSALIAMNLTFVSNVIGNQSNPSVDHNQAKTVTQNIKKYVGRNKYTLAGIVGVLAAVGGLKYYVNYIINPRLAQFDNDFASVLNNFICENNDFVRAVLRVCAYQGSDLLECYEKDLSTTSQQQLNGLNKAYIEAANKFMESFKHNQQILDISMINLSPIIDSFYETDWYKDNFSTRMRAIEGHLATGVGYCWTFVLGLKLLADSLKENEASSKESDSKQLC